MNDLDLDKPLPSVIANARNKYWFFDKSDINKVLKKNKSLEKVF